MSAFDRVIGYGSIKEELIRIVDMVHSPAIYEELGAKLPQGLMLHGEPGLGKTMMAKAFIKESGLSSYTIRRNQSSDEFVNRITETFREAKAHAPSIVFLDDMDKFANEDERHRDAEAYVAVQAGIDDVKNSNVFVLATANQVDKLPRSLMRSGRFDRKLHVLRPSSEDAASIIAYYLSTKKVADDINMDDLTGMISYRSCAQLESILNDAAITAAYARKPCIGMDDLIRSVLRLEYDLPDDCDIESSEEVRKIALHEAGHLVVCEALSKGIVGMAALHKSGISVIGGHVHLCKNLKSRMHQALVSLAGKTAVELYFSDIGESGCSSDMKTAYETIRDELSECGTHGLGLVDVATRRFPASSENLVARNEAVTQAELERLTVRARSILLLNREFLEAAQTALLEKGVLLRSDIQRIRDSVKVTEIVA